MIKLYQFPRGREFPSFSPFCAKLEAYLALSGLRYESEFVMNPAKAPKGKLPYVEMDGETIADSALIIDRLNARNEGLMDSHLSEAQRSTTVAYQVMLEEHLVPAMMYFRWQDEKGWQEFSEKIFSRLPKMLRLIVPRAARKQTLADLFAHGMGRHSPSEVVALARKDIRALSQLLGQEKFFFNGKPSLLDVVAVSVIGNILSDGPKRPLAKEVADFPNLVEHSERMQKLLRKV